MKRDASAGTGIPDSLQPHRQVVRGLSHSFDKFRTSFAAGPDHTTLERFEVWVCEHQHRTYFDEILRQIDADFPEERHQPQIGDTFAMRANAAKESLIRLIRHTCQCLLR
ncbi:MAG: hypothetical protein ACE5LU_04010, partial [Anaerolineae bacterium]